MKALSAAALATLVGLAHPAAAEAPRVSAEDRIAIGDLIAGIGLHADQGEWDRLAAAFAGEVTTGRARPLARPEPGRSPCARWLG